MKRRICSWILAVCTVLALAVNVHAEMRIKILYGKNELVCDVAPMLVNDRTMVPLRAIFEAIGATVDYEDETRKITAVKDAATVILHVGSDVMYVNGEEVMLDSPAFVVSGRTLVPLRACAESFGLTVEWWAEARIVKIKKGAWLLTETVFPNGETETKTYDERGNLIEHTQAGQTLHNTYDAMDNMLSNQAYYYTYDIYGNLTQVQHPYGQITTYTYNENRQIATEASYSKMSPTPTVYYHTYDAFGVLVRKESADGTYWETRTVDANGNVLRYEDSSGRWNSAVYDENGRLLETEDSLMPGKNTYEYDDSGNLIRLNRMDGLVESYAYDAAGRQILMQTSSGYYVRYTYDAEGRCSSRITENGTDSYVYDENGNLIETVHEDGTKTTYKYEYYML